MLFPICIFFTFCCCLFNVCGKQIVICQRKRDVTLVCKNRSYVFFPLIHTLLFFWSIAVKRSLHGRRVFLRAHSVEEALAMMGQNETHSMDPLSLESTTPDVVPLSMHTEEEGRIHGLLLQRNRLIEHPVLITSNTGESSYETLVDEVWVWWMWKAVRLECPQWGRVRLMEATRPSLMRYGCGGCEKL